MKKSILFLLGLLFVASCTEQNDEPTHQAKQPEVQHNSPTRIDDNIKKPTKETRSNTPHYFQYDVRISVISPAPHRL